MILDEMRQFVADRYGFKAWVETLRRSGREATMHYELDEVYPDAEVGLLAANAALVVGTPLPALLEAFGEAMLPDMVRVYSYLVDPGWTYADFVTHLEPLLVQALQVHTAGATQAKLGVRRTAPDSLEVVYESQMHACAAVHGVLVAAAREYGAKATVEQTQCVLKGAPHCVFEIRIDQPTVSRH